MISHVATFLPTLASRIEMPEQAITRLRKIAAKLKVTQHGHEPSIACHTGRHSCFFQLYKDGAWQAVEPVLKDPKSIYK